MRRSEPASAAVALVALVVLVAAAVPVIAAPASAPSGALPGALGKLDGVRQECIAAAREAQQQEQAIAALDHDIELLGRDAEGRQRGLDESRTEQAHLLETLLYLARDPPGRAAFAAGGAIERLRGELLVEGTLAGLRAEARALAGEIERVAALRTEIASRRAELADARQTLGSTRGRLAELIAQRRLLAGWLVPEDSDAAARIARLGHEAGDSGDLVKRADAATERRDEEVLARARAALPAARAGALTADAADPTRPPTLRAFDPPHTLLAMPVSGAITRRFGAADAATTAGGAGSQGLRLAASPGAIVVAPFDGRVIFAGPFRNLGLVLIIRHGALYHSLLAGLGQVDIAVGRWVLAGEPVGAMPGAVDKASGALYVEVRRDSRPVDPQPWLATRDAGRDEPDGDQKVRE